MELPSPVASLVPESRAQCSGDVGDRLRSAAIPIKRVPVLRDLGRRPRHGGEQSNGEEEEQQADACE